MTFKNYFLISAFLLLCFISNFFDLCSNSLLFFTSPIHTYCYQFSTAPPCSRRSRQEVFTTIVLTTFSILVYTPLLFKACSTKSFKSFLGKLSVCFLTIINFQFYCHLYFQYYFYFIKSNCLDDFKNSNLREIKNSYLLVHDSILIILLPFWYPFIDG